MPQNAPLFAYSLEIPVKVKIKLSCPSKTTAEQRGEARYFQWRSLLAFAAIL